MKEYLRADRLLHFIVGFAIANFMMTMLFVWFNLQIWEASLFTAVAMFIVAVAKEVYDSGKKDNFFDYTDAKATLIGGLIAIVQVGLIILISMD